ncbi:MAG: hypothetical protein ABI867_06745 [Kofleriaceae bacterium]
MNQQLLVATMVVLGVGVGCGPGKKPDKTTREALEYVPRDAQVVVSFDAAGLRDSTLWSDIAPALAKDREYRELRQCGIDLLDAFDRLTIAATSIDHPAGMFVIQGPKSQKFLDCVVKHDPTVTRDGDYLIAKDRHGDKVMLTAADGDTVVGVFGDDISRARLQTIVDHDSTITDDVTFSAITKQLDMRDLTWFVVAGTVLADAHLVSPNPIAMGGSVGIDSKTHIDARLVVRFDSADGAKEAESDARAMIRLTRIDEVSIDRDGEDLRISLDFSDKESKALLRKWN